MTISKWLYLCLNPFQALLFEICCLGRDLFTVWDQWIYQQEWNKGYLYFSAVEIIRYHGNIWQNRVHISVSVWCRLHLVSLKTTNQLGLSIRLLSRFKSGDDVAVCPDHASLCLSKWLSCRQFRCVLLLARNRGSVMRSDHISQFTWLLDTLLSIVHCCLREWDVLNRNYERAIILWASVERNEFLFPSSANSNKLPGPKFACNVAAVSLRQQ
jgi:hypothetical protein